MSLHEHVAKALHSAFDETSEHYTKELQRQAHDAGWPKEQASKVKVSHENDGIFKATFDGADDWEFGTIDRPPISVARTWESQAYHAANKEFETNLHKALGGLL